MIISSDPFAARLLEDATTLHISLAKVSALKKVRESKPLTPKQFKELCFHNSQVDIIEARYES